MQAKSQFPFPRLLDALSPDGFESDLRIKKK